MSGRAARAHAFLARAGWRGSDMEHLAGDASARSYTRLLGRGGQAILMDADPATGEDVRPFLHIARYLAEQGLSAPRILAADPDQGFLLLEDLGDALIARLSAADPAREAKLYAVTAEALDRLHRAPPASGLTAATPLRLAEMLDPFFDHYLPALGTPALTEDRAAITEALLLALRAHVGPPTVTMLRDFHAENLIWLPERTGVARIGLLDFQDAMLAHPAYDLVSLLRDARRDLHPGTEAATIDHYLALSGRNRDAFTAAYELLGVQRNLRILGVFVRLAAARGKPGYLSLIPRVWQHIEDGLAHPALADLAARLRPHLPRPDPALLDALKARCTTSP